MTIRKYNTAHLTAIIATILATFISCGYGDGDKHPNVRLIETGYNDDIYEVCPGKQSWYYITKGSAPALFDCNLKNAHFSFDKICGNRTFNAYTLGTGKICFSLLERTTDSNDEYSHGQPYTPEIIIVDIETQKAYKRFNYIDMHFLPEVIAYIACYSDTLRSLKQIPPLFALSPNTEAETQKEARLFHQIMPQAQEYLLQLIDKYQKYDYLIDGDSVKSYDQEKVYCDLMNRLQYTSDTTDSINPDVYQFGELYFMNASVAIGYHLYEWTPDERVPSLLHFENLPPHPNRANVQLKEFDYSLVWYSFPHLLKGSATKDELYYYSLSIDHDTLQFKYPTRVHLFESSRLKDGRVVIALNINSGEDDEDVLNPLFMKVFFLIYDPKKANELKLLSESAYGISTS